MIEYEEFRRAVTFSVGMTDPDQLMEPFVFADADGNEISLFLYYFLFYLKQPDVMKKVLEASLEPVFI